MKLTDEQKDRAYGAVVGSAAGDALGSHYEFGPPLPTSVPIEFKEGYFGHAPGEWTDDTSMAIPVLQEVPNNLLDPETLARVVEAWQGWAETSRDVGIQTRSVLVDVPHPVTEEGARNAAAEAHASTGRSGGNGSLMRAGPVALGFLDEDEEENLTLAATRVAELTHWERDNADACVLWSLAIRNAILTGELDVYRGLPWLPEERQERWQALIDEAVAPGATAETFHARNGWVVAAFQGALAALNTTDSLVDALEAAVRGGKDTDTVAAIAGSLGGAIYGASALPEGWVAILHGWPGLNSAGLETLVDEAVETPSQ